MNKEIQDNISVFLKSCSECKSYQAFAILLTKGNDDDLDINTVLHFYETAANQGSPDAAAALSKIYLDGDYVKKNEKYLLGFDSLATITYNRGVITLIGDEMWRVQQVASRTSAKIGEAGLNILNMDAQEETSRIIIVVEDAADNIRKAISAIHQEISEINFI